MVPGTVYGFAPMTVVERNRTLANGRREAAAEQARQGFPNPVQAGAGSQQVWVLAEMVEGHMIGEQVAPPIGHACTCLHTTLCICICHLYNIAIFIQMLYISVHIYLHI